MCRSRPTRGPITGLIGPNGAGKTTLFNVITRLYKPDEGRVVFDGDDLLRTPPYRIVRRGVARTFQNVVLFPTMTVTENVLVGAHTRMRPFGERKARASALETLEYLGLSRFAGRPAAGLPFGTLKRIELARALVSKPAPAAARRAGRRPQPRGGRGAERPAPTGCRRTST